jgi:hypothetical protein
MATIRELRDGLSSSALCAKGSTRQTAAGRMVARRSVELNAGKSIAPRGTCGPPGARQGGWLPTVIVLDDISVPVFVCIGTSTAGQLGCHSTHEKHGS